MVTFARKKILCEPENIALLKTAIRLTQARYPIVIDALVLLPDHLHTIWTLPLDDMNYSMRWNTIKGCFSRHCLSNYKSPKNPSQKHKRAQTIWQARFWKHQIRDDLDYEKHCDYIHWNPVKHGLVDRVEDSPFSSFDRFMQKDFYPQDWTGMKDNRAVSGETYGE